jgi:nicotinamidase-related amidase
MQTEYCIDATCKAAFEHGFSIIIPEQTNTTFDNQYMNAKTLYEFYHYQIWQNRFARVLPMEEVEQLIKEA